MENITVTFGAMAKDGSVWQFSDRPLPLGEYVVVSDGEGHSVEGVVVSCNATGVDEWKLNVRPDWSTWIEAPEVPEVPV